MKNKILIFSAVLMFVFACGNSDNSDESANMVANSNSTFSIEGMVCEENCANYIERKIENLEGVKSCEVDFEGKLATVVYDNDKTSSQKFVDLVEGLEENKYEVSDLKTKKINLGSLETTSQGSEEETGNIISGSTFELPNIIEYFRNII